MGENPHVDYEALTMLKEVMEEEYESLIDTFIKDGVVRIKAIKAALESKDGAELRATAHSFKGSSSNLGAHHLSDLCAQMEKRGLSGEFDGGDALLLKIIKEYKEVAKALVAYR